MSTNQTIVEILKPGEDKKFLSLEAYSNLLGKRVMITYLVEAIPDSDSPELQRDRSEIIIATIVAMELGIHKNCKEDTSLISPRPDIYSAKFVISNDGYFFIAYIPDEHSLIVVNYSDRKEDTVDAQLRFLD